MQQEIIKCLTGNKTHLAEIEGAHIARDCNYMMDNYRVIEADAEENETAGIATGGTAIMIHGRLQQHIAQITRQSSRSIRVTLGHAKSKMPIHIVSTYAPRNGHTEEARGKHWGGAKELLNETCRRHLILWGADANGQMGNRNQSEEEERYAKKGKCRSRDNWTIHESEQEREGERSATAQNMQKTTNDTNDNLERTKNRRKRQMEAAAKRGNEGKLGKNSNKNTPQHGPARMET